MKEQLIEKIRRKMARLVVVGLGHVGLTTATMFAEAGFQTIGVDIKRQIVETVSSGKSNIREPALDELLGKSIKEGRLQATMDTIQAMKDADIGIVCVQTPVTESKEPNQTYLQEACESIAQGLSQEQLIVIESTVSPGMTKNLVADTLEKGSGLKCGEDFWLAHCPERIAVGNAIQDFVENARIIGGFNSESTKVAVELFKTVTKGEILTTDCTSAEIAKAAENTFRDVNIALANELALICEQMGVDVMEVVRLANTHRRVNIHKPGCGVGGPCITKDPYLLLHTIKERGFKSKIIEPSRELNDYMPDHTVKLLAKALKKAGKDVETSKIAVLGVAYKGEVDDTRDSPAERIVDRLMKLSAEISVFDPYCKESFGAEKAEDIMDAVKGADCIVIVTDHTMFKELKLERIKALMNEKPVIVDGRRVLTPVKARNEGFIYVGIGSV